MMTLIMRANGRRGAVRSCRALVRPELLVLVAACTLVSITTADWTLPMEGIFADELIAPASGGMGDAADTWLRNLVVRQDDGASAYDGLPPGITVCVPAGSGDAPSSVCGANLKAVTGGSIDYDVLQQSQDGVDVPLSFLAKGSGSSDFSKFSTSVTSSDGGVVNSDDVMVDETNSVGSALNYTLVVPVHSTSLGKTDVSLKLSVGGESYTFTWRFHVLGMSVGHSVLSGDAQVDGDSVVIPDFNSAGTIVLAAKTYFESSSSGGNNPTLNDVEINFIDGTDWNQVTYNTGVCGAVTASGSGSGVTLPDEQCGMGFTASGDGFAMRFNPGRVGYGKVSVEFRVSGLVVNGVKSDDYVASHVLDVVINNWMLATPIIDKITVPSKLDSGGGSRITVRGYNFPLQPEYTYDGEVGNSYSLYELESERREFPETFEQELTFVNGPGSGSGLDVTLVKNAMGQKISFEMGNGDVTKLTYSAALTTPSDVSNTVTVRYTSSNLSPAKYFSHASEYGGDLAKLGAAQIDKNAFTTAVLAHNDGSDITVVYYVPDSKTDSTAQQIQKHVKDGDFQQKTGYDIAVSDIVSSGPSVVNHVATSVDAAVVSGVSVVVVLTMSTQVVAVLMGAELFAAHTAHVLPSAINLTTTSAVNTVQTAILPVQMLSGRGLVNVNTTDPFVGVAAQTSGYLLRLPLPWQKSEQNLVPITYTSGSTTTQRQSLSVSNFYDAAQSTDFVNLFVGQLFFIACGIALATILHVFLHFVFRRRRRAHRIAMRIMANVEVMYLNLIHLGIFISVSEVFSKHDQVSVYVLLLAVLVLVVFGLGYPVFIGFVLWRIVRPKLNNEWLKNYYRRFLMLPSWPCFDKLRTEEELHAMELSWQQERGIDKDGQPHKFAYVVHKRKRFSGLWQSQNARDNSQAMFGSMFVSFKGQFFFYFLVEVLIMSVEGVIMGGGQNHGALQALLLLVFECLSMFLVVWTLPFNDVFENLFAIFINVLDVVISIIQYACAFVAADSTEAFLLSSVMLYINVAVIGMSVLFVLVDVLEGVWKSRHSIARCIRNIFGADEWDDHSESDEDDDDGGKSSYQDREDLPEYALYYLEHERTEARDVPVYSSVADIAPPRKQGSTANFGDLPANRQATRRSTALGWNDSAARGFSRTKDSFARWDSGWSWK